MAAAKLLPVSTNSAVPNTVLPSRKVTVPVIVSAAAPTWVTVTVSVTGWLRASELADNCRSAREMV